MTCALILLPQCSQLAGIIQRGRFAWASSVKMMETNSNRSISMNLSIFGISLSVIVQSDMRDCEFARNTAWANPIGVMLRAKLFSPLILPVMRCIMLPMVGSTAVASANMSFCLTIGGMTKPLPCQMHVFLV